MHVALVLMTGNPEFAGGVPAVTMERARYLAKNGWIVSIVCSSLDDWQSPEERDGIWVYPVKPTIGRIDLIFQRFSTRSPFFLRKLRLGLEMAHARNPIDLVDLQDGPAILGAGPFCRAHRVPMTFTIHGSAALNPAPRPWLGRKLHVIYEGMAWKQAKLVLPVSLFIATAGKRFGDFAAKVRVVPNTVREAWLEKGRSRPHSKSKGLLKLLFLGRIAPEKRLADLLQAMAKLEPGTAMLDVVGGGPLESEAQTQAHDLGIEDRVKFHGFQSDRPTVERFLMEADAFVFPTEFEAMSVALLEAMAFGLYPIASDIAPNAEVLPTDFLFPLGDVGTLADWIRQLAENRSDLIPASVRMVELASMYRVESVYPRLLEAYTEAVGPIRQS